MLRAAERQDLERLITPRMHLARQVVQPGHLPAAGLRDSANGPRQHLVVQLELAHRLSDADELVRTRQVPAEQPDQLVDIAVEDREPLARVPNRERVSALVLGDGSPVRGDAFLTECARVADRIGLEEVLLDEPEPNHPTRERHRVRDARITRASVQVQHLGGQAPDQTVGVVSVQDHLHQVADRPLQQLHQRARRRRLHGALELGDDRPSRHRPARAFPIVEKPAGPEPTVHLGAQLREIACGATGDQTDVPFDIAVLVDRRQHDLTELVLRQPGDELLDRRLRRFAWHRATSGRRRQLLERQGRHANPAVPETPDRPLELDRRGSVIDRRAPSRADRRDSAD